MHKAVERGLSRRDLQNDEVSYLNIDEKSYRKGHNYITVLSEGTKKRILDVIEGRTSEATEKLLENTLTGRQLKEVKVACMDMWDGFINGFKKNAQMLRLYSINSILLNV